MEIFQQQEIANEILDLLECVDINSILAGGAPRDWTFGNPARDLDFYFDANRGEVDSFIRVVRRFRSLGLPIYIKNGYNYDGKNPDLLFVFDGEYKGIKVQLMWMKTPALQAMNSFALDICRVGYKDGKFIYTDEFEKARQSKTIRVLSSLYGKQDKYVQKILRRFPDFTLVEDK